MRKRPFKSSINIENAAYRDHIDETTPLNVDGKCDNIMMVHNVDKNYCTLADRVDIARHHVLTGGVSSSKKFKDELSDTLTSIFSQHYFWDDKNNIDSVPDASVLNTLLKADKFRSVTAKFCPLPSLAFRETIAITTHLPGQETPMHYDQGLHDFRTGF